MNLIRGLGILHPDLDIVDPEQSRKQCLLHVLEGGHGLSRYSVHFWKDHVIALLCKTSSGPEVDEVLDLLDQLHEKHQDSQDLHARSELQPPKLIESSEEEALPSVLLRYPHLVEMVLRFIQWEKTQSQEVFSNGNGAYEYLVS